jgi:hypothetical protein
MPPLRVLVPFFLVAPLLAHASEDAMAPALQCVHAGMTSSLTPVTASAEQLASVAVGRCTDQIETAASSLAGTPVRADRVDLSRIAVRRALFDYALALASGGTSSVVADTESRYVSW